MRILVPTGLLADAKQAISLSLTLIEWEIEQPAIDPPPEAWRSDLRRAACTLRSLLQWVSPQGDRLNGIGTIYNGPRRVGTGQLPPKS